jgi:predicted dithiol-disulfide oxidoreductase (DUF899 family)
MKIEPTERERTGIGGVNPHKIVSKAGWLVSRKDLLKREKELTHLRDEISRHRRELPRGEVEKNYVFESYPGSTRITKPKGACT